MKKIQKPFDIEAWKNGAKIETRDGRKVRILCTDLIGKQPIVAAVMGKDGEEGTMHTCIDGRYYMRCEDSLDIVIVEEVEEPKRWADDANVTGYGWYINPNSCIECAKFLLNADYNYSVFATEKQAKSALAMARISQLMAHDKRYGGVVTDEEWQDDYKKYCIGGRRRNRLWRFTETNMSVFLAFHTEEQRDLFLSENEQLVKDYLMID